MLNYTDYSKLTQSCFLVYLFAKGLNSLEIQAFLFVIHFNYSSRKP
jgi:hypothetical protein